MLQSIIMQCTYCIPIRWSPLTWNYSLELRYETIFRSYKMWYVRYVSCTRLGFYSIRPPYILGIPVLHYLAFFATSCYSFVNYFYYNFQFRSERVNISEYVKFVIAAIINSSPNRKYLQSRFLVLLTSISTYN